MIINKLIGKRTRKALLKHSSYYRRKKLLKRFARLGKNVDLDNPLSLTDKICWLMVYGGQWKRKAQLADKIAVHQYCKQKLGKDICVPILHVYESPDMIRLEELPEQFALKCNHGCKFNIIVPNREELCLEEAQEQLRTWQDTPFGMETVEAHYLFIKPQCYAEQYIVDDTTHSTIEYDFYCPNGRPTLLHIISGRLENDLHQGFYDMDFHPLDVRFASSDNQPQEYAKPAHFDLMKEYAAKLSADLPFARIDFYEANDEVYLGEITLTPAAGNFGFSNRETDLLLGSQITISLS